MQLGLVDPLDNGALYMSKIELFIGQSSTEGERKRRARMKISEQKRLREEKGVCAPARLCMVLRLCSSASIA